MKKERSKNHSKKKQTNLTTNQNNDVPIVEKEQSHRSISSEENSQDAIPVIGDRSLIKQELKKFLVPVLRRASYRWKPRSEALKKARVDRGLYQCNSCKESFKQTDICLDHVFPVVNPKVGFIEWNSYIERMFPDIDGFQVLCKLCHDVKTKLEDEMRKIYNKKGKTNE
ncbi:hypothetical protein EBZ38_07530 [bacterium]|jgi:hypothetical protein|nr:hypothetical protein [bacterium]